MCVSGKVDGVRASKLARFLRVKLVKCHELYLGLPSFAVLIFGGVSSRVRNFSKLALVGELGGEIQLKFIRIVGFLAPLPSRSNSVISWSPPCSGLFKINSDAELDVGNGKVGLGIIIRDSEGEILACRASPILAGFSPLISEVVAVLHGLSFAWEVRLFPCSIESDA
ncbi:hypothetical protein LWI28_005846 [Acer negundo]|uniref:RNase H type-1 domain-containing protein n=1 Tax=Acer negundo TaxID=4023 RepID=A0AAD5JIN3_ACENE|nr:hypothetical protein LWI28_005846 [Acer negundo]